MSFGDKRLDNSLDHYLTTPPEENEDAYNHNFDSLQVCGECDETEDDCECDSPIFEDSEWCSQCGNLEDDPVHGEQ